MSLGGLMMARRLRPRQIRLLNKSGPASSIKKLAGLLACLASAPSGGGRTTNIIIIIKRRPAPEARTRLKLMPAAYQVFRLGPEMLAGRPMEPSKWRRATMCKAAGCARQAAAAASLARKRAAN